MKDQTQKEFNVNIKVIDIQIKGVITHYPEDVWINDPNDEEGGFYQTVEKKYPHPKIKYSFVGETDTPLTPYSVYSDGKNMFYADKTNQVVNLHSVTEEFTIPKKLVLVTELFGK